MSKHTTRSARPITSTLAALALGCGSLAGCGGSSSNNPQDGLLLIAFLAGGRGFYYGRGHFAPAGGLHAGGSGHLELVSDQPLDALAGAQLIASRPGLPDLAIADVDVEEGATEAELMPAAGVELPSMAGVTLRLVTVHETPDSLALRVR